MDCRKRRSVRDTTVKKPPRSEAARVWSSSTSRRAPARATTASYMPRPRTVSPPARICSMKYPRRMDASATSRCRFAVPAWLRKAMRMSRQPEKTARRPEQPVEGEKGEQEHRRPRRVEDGEGSRARGEALDGFQVAQAGGRTGAVGRGGWSGSGWPAVRGSRGALATAPRRAPEPAPAHGRGRPSSGRGRRRWRRGWTRVASEREVSTRS